jgi:type II secretion system protein D
MKKMRDHLLTLGASCVLTLSVVLAQDQAPAPQPEAAPVAAEPAAIPAPAEPAQPAALVRPPASLARQRMAGPAPASGSPAARLAQSVLNRRNTALPADPASFSTEAAASGTSLTNADGSAKSKTTMPAMKFNKSPVENVVKAYCDVVEKTPLWTPEALAIKAEITIVCHENPQFTRDEYLEAIEAVLIMHGLVLEPFGEKFMRVLARQTVRTAGIKIGMDLPEAGIPEKGKVLSQMIQLKALMATDAQMQKVLEMFLKKPEGQFQVFERTNSILVTDTQENINRILEIIKFIDQPVLIQEKVFYKVIRFAKAKDIETYIRKLTDESQQQQKQAKEEITAKTTGAPGTTRQTPATSLTPRPTSPLLRFGLPPPPAAVAANETLEALVSDAERGMIRGTVQILADERTNQLIIITREDNMAFFDKIISVLDIETTPDVKVEVQRLEYADAEDVASMLNDLIGNVSSKKDEKTPTGAATKGKDAPKSGSTPGTPSSEPPAKSTTLAEAVAAKSSARAEAAVGEAGKSKLGQLSKDNIKILADKRTNALVMMGSGADLAAIKEIIKGMDIQLAQVLIETVALEVSLGDTLATGIDWVKRVQNPSVAQPIYKTTIDAAGKEVKTLVGYTPASDYLYGAGGGGGGSKMAQNLFDLGTNAIGGVVTSGSAGIEYLATIKSLNLDAIITASKTDSRTKVLSSPVLLTVDNKEASIEATDLKYMYKGMRYMGYSSGSSYGGNSGYGGGGYEPDIEQRDVGLTVKVTPRINPNGYVTLTIEEKFEDVVEPGQKINGQDWPTVTTRKISADVSVGNGETVILGGLVKTLKGDSSSGIPILKDIPYIGKYLFGSVSVKESRSEMLVFLTPYVLKTAEDMARETRRRKDYVNAPDIWTKGWSDSKLADPVSAAEMKDRLSRKKDMEKAWREYGDTLEKSRAQDVKVDAERTKTEILPGTNAPLGTLKVETSVEVLKPTDVEGAPESPASGADEEPVQPAIEEPRKPWWKIY